MVSRVIGTENRLDIWSGMGGDFTKRTSLMRRLFIINAEVKQYAKVCSKRVVRSYILGGIIQGS